MRAFSSSSDFAHEDISFRFSNRCDRADTMYVHSAPMPAAMSVVAVVIRGVTVDSGNGISLTYSNQGKEETEA
jgi:hypothetical protein